MVGDTLFSRSPVSTMTVGSRSRWSANCRAEPRPDHCATVAVAQKTSVTRTNDRAKTLPGPAAFRGLSAEPKYDGYLHCVHACQGGAETDLSRMTCGGIFTGGV